ncbi:MAG: helix-turn-helix domain-containing protein [Polaribacter sp.]
MERPKLNMEKIKKLPTVGKLLDEKYGKEGTKNRKEFNNRADAYYIGQLLKNARKEAGITQFELANRLGVDEAYVSRIENGKLEPAISVFYKIASALGLSVSLTPV